MNHSSSTSVESGSPAIFVLLSTLVGVLAWLYVMLSAMPPQ